VRILVTGSRTWDDYETLTNALDNAYFGTAATAPVTLVHGACPDGADAIASAWVAGLRQSGWIITEERHPADWQGHGKAAGFIRNAEMVKAGADVCLAFIRDGSRGATHTAGLAEKAGIPVRRWTA
jgi:hypothetical protein